IIACATAFSILIGVTVIVLRATTPPEPSRPQPGPISLTTCSGDSVPDSDISAVTDEIKFLNRSAGTLKRRAEGLLLNVFEELEKHELPKPNVSCQDVLDILGSPYDFKSDDPLDLGQWLQEGLNIRSKFAAYYNESISMQIVPVPKIMKGKESVAQHLRMLFSASLLHTLGCSTPAPSTVNVTTDLRVDYAVSSCTVEFAEHLIQQCNRIAADVDKNNKN
ncbi:hypothetical protein BaRGS_00008019, partial [Batillaria attramentaria]